MSVELTALVIFVSFLIFMFLGTPVAFLLIGLSALLGFILVGSQALYAMPGMVISVMTNELYIAIPLFVLMGTVLEVSGIGGGFYDAMYKWAGSFKGGLAIGTVLACTILAAITGMAATGTVLMGMVALPEMFKRGYDRNIALGCIVSGGALGPLIPPSIIMVVLGGYAGLSVGKLFIGGVIPGLLISGLTCLYIGIRCAIQKNLAPSLPPEELATWREKLVCLRQLVPAVLLVLAVLGSLYTGATTPTEASGAGAIGAIICALVYRQFSWGKLKQAVFTSFKVSQMVLWLLVGGITYSTLLTVTGVGGLSKDALLRLPLSPIGIISIIMLVTFIMGMLMDQGAIIMIATPVFMPVAITLGYDPYWFALIFVINLCLGYLTPPFGFGLFYLKGVVPKDITMADIISSQWAFTGLWVVGLVLCVVFPSLLLWLPSRMG